MIADSPVPEGDRPALPSRRTVMFRNCASELGRQAGE